MYSIYIESMYLELALWDTMLIVTMVSSEYFHFSLTTEIVELRDVIYGISQNGSGKVQTLQASRLCSILCFSL